MFLRNIQADLAPDDERRAAYVLLQGIVRALDHQLSRHSGPGALYGSHQHTAHQPQDVARSFRDLARLRREPPQADHDCLQYAWKQLQKFAEAQGNLSPTHLTPKTMSALVEKMRADKLSVKTINERLRKVRSAYMIAIGREMLKENPAERTLGIKVPSHMKGRENASRSHLQNFRPSLAPLGLPNTQGRSAGT